MKRLIATTLLALASSLSFAPIASAETAAQVITDERGITWMIDLDSRYAYINDRGVRQVRFKLSTSGDSFWHPAIASCAPYDVASPYYGWNWSGTRSFPAGSVGGNISRAACHW
ncbi:MAG: hypothetical protein KME35_00245 [Aphanocapsa sp. GSE-SYN-MK-11-07L]|nr:hypothetical protein [Aphanocapsa sp. GSE-SYN-MK-11-07L]